MAEKKMTKREHFENILTYVQDIDREFVEHELELLAKKNTAERKPTAKQVENEGFAAAILDWMEPDTLYSVAEIAKSCPILVEHGITSARVTPMLTKLKDAGKVIRTEDKRKAFYSLA